MTVNIGALSYGLAGVAFLLLSVMLVTSWRGRVQWVSLAAAGLLSAAWAWVAAFAPEHSLIYASLEVLKSAAWMFFLVKAISLLPTASSAQRTPLLRRIESWLVAYVAVLLVASAWLTFQPVSGAERALFLTEIVGRALLAVAGMVLVEQFFRNTAPSQRWGVKHLCLGLGAMFAYDFFLYSDAMLFRQIDTSLWAARGIINAIIVPLILISVARNPQWSFHVHVSRRIVFHTASLLGAGLYLLVMAGAGYYLRVVGGTWGSVFQAAFFFGAIVLLVSLLFSGTFRARLKVLLSKHFFSYKYDYREEWLRFTRALSGTVAGARPQEKVIQAIAGLVESPAAVLYWKDRDAPAFNPIAQWNSAMDLPPEPADSPLTCFLARKQWVVNLHEYEALPETYGDLLVPEWLNAIPRAWLVVPLILDDRLMGFIVLTESRGRIAFNWEVSDLLKTAGRQATSYLAQLDAAQALVEARQFESFNRMSAFVVHDLKNLVAQLSLMLTNAEKHKGNPEFQEDMLSTVESSVAKMNRLLQQLRARTEGGVDSEIISLGPLLDEVIQSKSVFKPKPTLTGEKGLRIRANREQLLRVLGHIVQNACEATPYDGKVAVRLGRDGAYAIVAVEDSGAGMDDQFVRERLFRPFDSTKGNGMGIGAYECREYVKKLGGVVAVTSSPGKGTVFEIRLPVIAEVEGAGQPA